jgi:hypothetical protein
MKTPSLIALCALSLGLVLSTARVRADDPSGPPPPPPPPGDTSPENGGEGPGGHHGRRHEPGYSLAELTSKLSLTADQQTKVGAVIDSAKEQSKQLRGDDSLSWDDKRAKMKANAKSTHDQIRALLTADQQKAFDALPPPHGGRPPHNPDSN